MYLVAPWGKSITRKDFSTLLCQKNSKQLGGEAVVFGWGWGGWSERVKRGLAAPSLKEIPN